MPDPPADHGTALREHGFHELKVKRVVRETPDASSFVLEVPADLRETFRYRPGQFCTFRVRLEDGEELRSYSMSSAPETDDDLAVTVKRVPGGIVSNWLLDRLTEGSVVEATRPAGVFCPRRTERPLMAFCGGSGITPVLSIVKAVLVSTSRPVKLLYANRDPASVIFRDLLDELAGRYPGRVELRHHSDAECGYLTPGDVVDFASAATDADCYICGPAPFMDLVEAALVGLGVDPGRIFIERFTPEHPEPGKTSTDGATVSPPAGATDGMTGATMDEPAATPESVTVILAGKRSSIAYHPGNTLLETARRGGLRPPFSCESGDCATCMAFLKEGSVRMRANNALTEEEVEEGWILTCQALPTAPSITVEYEAM